MPPGPTGARTPTRAWPSSATACSGLAITAHLYPRLEAERYGAGRLTKIRAQTVSGPSCRAVAERLGVPDVPGGRGARRAWGRAPRRSSRPSACWPP